MRPFDDPRFPKSPANDFFAREQERQRQNNERFHAQRLEQKQREENAFRQREYREGVKDGRSGMINRGFTHDYKVGYREGSLQRPLKDWHKPF